MPMFLGPAAMLDRSLIRMGQISYSSDHKYKRLSTVGLQSKV